MLIIRSNASANSATCIFHSLTNINFADDVCPYTNIIHYCDDNIIELYASSARTRARTRLIQQ